MHLPLVLTDPEQLCCICGHGLLLHSRVAAGDGHTHVDNAAAGLPNTGMLTI